MEIIIRADRVKNEKAFTQSQRVKDKFYVHYEGGGLTVLVTPRVETAF